MKKKRQQEAATEAKALAVLDAKASYFEENNYKGLSVQDLTALLAWYKIPKEKPKKSDMVARWKEIRNPQAFFTSKSKSKCRRQNKFGVRVFPVNHQKAELILGHFDAHT